MEYLVDTMGSLIYYNLLLLCSDSKINLQKFVIVFQSQFVFVGLMHQEYAFH